MLRHRDKVGKVRQRVTTAGPYYSLESQFICHGLERVARRCKLNIVGILMEAFLTRRFRPVMEACRSGSS